MPDPHAPIAIRRSFRCDPHRAIARRDGTLLDGLALQLSAAAVAHRLRSTKMSEWAICVDSPFLALAALNAVQSLGARSLLLPHRRPGLLATIRGRGAGLILQGGSDSLDDVALPDLNTLVEEGRELGGLDCDWQQPVGLLTSGSAGEPVSVFKSPGQLIDEIEMIESAFGVLIGQDRLFCGTTSHQHLYGFTFRVMWPFLSGRLMSDDQIRIPGEVNTALRFPAGIVLISSPAFLDRARSLIDFGGLSATRFIGFSSGGPLKTDTALQFNQADHVTLVEIYGSTETGALASRITAVDPAPPWRPLPGVSFEIVDGLLCVRASHLADGGPLVTEDLAAASSDGFVLEGRRDRVVKIADKRVSLGELERLLNAHPDVDEARVVVLNSGVLGAVVVPRDTGWSAIAESGKTAYCKTLRAYLAGEVERVTTPKRWRLVRTLRRNAQGKIELERLTALFAAPNGRIEWEVIEATADRWCATATIRPDLPELDGHFPGNPIVPGVAQLSWAAGCARRAFQLPEVFGSLEAVKFRNILVPGDRIRLTLELNGRGDRVSFDISDDRKIYSSGRLLVASD